MDTENSAIAQGQGMWGAEEGIGGLNKWWWMEICLGMANTQDILQMAFYDIVHLKAI